MNSYIENQIGINLYEEKILETISVGCGTSYKIRGKGDFSSAKTNDLVQYCANCIDIDKSENIIERTMKRLIGQEIKKQENLDAIVQMSIDLISNNEIVTNKNVESDWAMRFVNHAEQVSGEEMRAAWAKVLSQEVSKPGSFSLRTLDILRNMSKEEAKTFMKISQFVLRNGKECFLPNIIGAQDFLDRFDVTYDDLLKMEEVGLINAAPDLVGTFESNDNNVVIVHSDVALVFKFENVKPIVSIDMFILTKAGRELLQIIGTQRNDDYYRQLVEVIHVNAKDVGLCNLVGQNENGDDIYDDESFVSLLRK